MKRLIILASLMLLAAGCTMSAERNYVRKAVKLMDRHALFAQGSAWEEARSEAMAADPSPAPAKNSATTPSPRTC